VRKPVQPAIQLIPDFEMAEYNRQDLVFEKEDLLIDSEGKYPGYNFYKVAGIDAGIKSKGEGETEDAPVDTHSLLP
jgi:NADH-quinone oxidoreductase subunit I